MTNRKQALEALRDQVKAGVKYETMGHTIMCQKAFPKPDDFDGSREAYANSSAQLAILVWRNDDLNATKALHDAVLPGRHFNVATEANMQGFYATASPKQWGNSFVACSETPARAWLLAILEALISETPDTPKGETP